MKEGKKGGENQAYLDLQREIWRWDLALAATRSFNEEGILVFYHEKFSASAEIRSCASAREESHSSMEMGM